MICLFGFVRPFRKLDCADYKPGKKCWDHPCAPKCGNNGHTYRNRCAILKQKCKNGLHKGNPTLDIAHQGPCASFIRKHNSINGIFDKDFICRNWNSSH